MANKYVILNKDGERATTADGDHLVFSNRIKAFNAAVKIAKQEPNEEIEVYERVTVAIAPAQKVELRHDTRDSGKPKRTSRGKVPLDI